MEQLNSSAGVQRHSGEQPSLARGQAPSSPVHLHRTTAIHWPSLSHFGLLISVLILNTVLLFIVIPQASSQIRPLYNGNVYADGYDQIAENLAQGKGYRFFPDTARTLLREPGYPILLAGIFLVFGKNFAVVKSTNMLLAFATAFLIARIARSLTNNRLLTWGAPLLFMAHPVTLIAESRGGVEILFAFMLTLFMLTVQRAISTNRWWDYLISGGVLGLTVLVRSTPILFPLFLFAYLWLRGRQQAQTALVLRNFLIIVIALFVVLSPWIIRNYMLTGEFVPTASVLGVAADAGFYLSSHHAIGNLVLDTQAARERDELARGLGYAFRAGYYQYFYSSADELAFSHYLFRRVVQGYLNSPGLFLETVSLNLLRFWCGGKTLASVVMAAILQVPFLVLAFVGVAFHVKSGRFSEIAPMVLLVLYIVAVSLPILAQARYSVPLVPFLSLFACAGLGVLTTRLRGERSVKHAGLMNS